MKEKKKILAISGSTRSNSTNFKILQHIAEKTNNIFEIKFFESLAELPHFNPDLDTDNPPKEVAALREQILNSDAIIICTPEYIFSLPGSLKNVFEWCVSTTVFTDKKVGLITASASGIKGHEELTLIMKTVGAIFNDETAILIQGIRGKMNPEGKIIDDETNLKINSFINSLNGSLKV